MGGEDIVITDHGKVVEVNPTSWPSGIFLRDMLKKEAVEFTEQEEDPTFWQVSARWALMKKFGFTEVPAADRPNQRKNGRRQCVFHVDDIASIQSQWENLLNQEDPENDLLDFVKSSKSNDRQLQWSTMYCPPGCQFKLHAHPNLELIYCAKGAFYGIRMQGKPFTKSFEKLPDDSSKLKGPNLKDTNRSWFFETLNEGEWLVNEIGSIHKSFTATSGDGCILLVLWGGSHANILNGEQPTKVNVQKALDTMDEKLGQCCCTNGESISETFLPESEKKNNASKSN